MAATEFVTLGVFSILLALLCMACGIKRIQRRRRNQGLVIGLPSQNPTAPVVVTTTTIPTVPQSAGYPAQSTIVQGYPMPQPQPGYPPQPAGMYPNQPMPQPYPMPPIQADYNPPSYDQVVRGGDAYQKQAPYNPNYSGQQ
ncbi:protein shisa-5 isoform X4 [Sitodiplosis mosellana]|uniref:protein shisa-5 isoform X4 n=1 Tax=Sitodiplosis mosellana TaxID=263140 RepID=UPI002444AEB2|nr:protein shisa-5 isoform X4 [Sitodiplosis mosellana]